MNKTKRILSKNLKEVIEASGMTCYRVAKELGVDEAYVYKWRSGKISPDQPNIEKLCELFGIPIMRLYYEEERKSDIKKILFNGVNNGREDSSNAGASINENILEQLDSIADSIKGLRKMHEFYRNAFSAITAAIKPGHTDNSICVLQSADTISNDHNTHACKETDKEVDKET